MLKAAEVLPGADGALPGLEGRVFLVTEAGRPWGDGQAFTGIGEAFALLAARAGARLALVDRSASRLALTRALIEDLGARVITIPVNIADPAAAAGAVAVCRVAFGRLDGLINHVTCVPDPADGACGAPAAGGASHPTGAGAEGALRLARAAAGFMARSGGGVLVSFACADAAGAEVHGELLRLNRLLGQEFAALGVRANAVRAPCPGPDHPHPEPAGAWLRTRHAGTWHAARAMLHLVSDEARHLSGAVLSPEDPVPLSPPRPPPAVPRPGPPRGPSAA